MACPLAEFLAPLLREGRVVLRQRPEPPRREEGEAARLLERAYAGYRLAVAGPLIPFDREAALAAALLLQQACWLLVNREQPAAELGRALAAPGPPRSPAQHLSADLVLRFLPQVHRRARAFDPADPLTAWLADRLRRWPLTGVLSEVEDGPLAPLDFAGHPGLLLLYAERWSQKPKPAWMPRGEGFEYLQWVWSELGKDPAALEQAEPGAGRLAGAEQERGWDE